MYEGRELHVINIPRNATSKEVKQLFSGYGSVESVRLPGKLNGDHKGLGFVVFRHQKDASRALALNKTTWMGRTLTVVESSNDPAKRQASKAASNSHRDTASPSPAANGHASSTASPAPAHLDTKMEIQSRTFALLNVPDTVNDSRIRAIAEPHGEVVKVLLRPDHQGAIIEYKHQASVGKAAMALEGHEIVPGRSLRVGSVEEMKKLKGEVRSDKIVVGQRKNVAALPTPTQVRRPAVGAGRRGGKGGLGVKRGGVGLDGERAKTTDEEPQGQRRDEDPESKAKDGKPKTNADFKAMLMGK